MKTRTVSVKINTYGNAPAKYGQNALKVRFESLSFLLSAGWRHVGTGRQYDYAIPPAGFSDRDPIVDLLVPIEEEILSIALRLHAGQKSCEENIEGVVVRYLAACEVSNANLTFGVGWRPWSVEFEWIRGNDEPPSWFVRMDDFKSQKAITWHPEPGVLRLQEELQKWMVSNELTHDTKWWLPDEYFGAGTQGELEKIRLVLTFEGDLYNVFWGFRPEPEVMGLDEKRRLRAEFEEIVDRHGYWYDFENNNVLQINDPNHWSM